MWDEKFSADHYIYGKEPNGFLKQSFQNITKGRVLCLAEGEGRNSVFLAQQGYTVTAVDSSSVGLRKTQKLAEEKGVSITCIQSDLADYDLGVGQWEGIVSVFCHLPEMLRKELHKRVVKGLKPGGTFLLEAYTPAQLNYSTGGPPTADLLMTAKVLRQELNGLQFSKLQEIEREVIEGTHHSGHAAIVQAIAGKP